MSSIGRGLQQFSGGIQPLIAALLQASQQKQQQGQGVAALNGIMAGGGAPAPLGAPPAPAAPGAPPMGGAPSPMGGGGPPAPMARPPMPAPGGGAPPAPGAPVPGMGAPPSPMGGGAPAPAAPSPQPGAGAAPAPTPTLLTPSGVFGQDSAGTIKSMADRIKKANPGISPKNLLGAVNQGVAMLKGVSSDDKAYLQAQVQMAAIDQRHQASILASQTREDAMEAQMKMLTDKMEVMSKIASGHDAARTDAADVGATSRERVAGTNAGARVQSAQIGAGSREKVGAGHDATQRYGADKRSQTAGATDASRERIAGTNRAARENAAAITAGQKPPHPDAPMGGGGGKPTASAGDLDYLKKHNTPQNRAGFDKQYGQGAAMAALSAR